MQIQYFNIEDFDNVYLEDSYVLQIKSNSSGIEFLVDVVLTENHALYSRPKKNEMYCYRKAKINFPTAVEIIWIEINVIPATDAAGEIDFGNIDSFFYDGNYYNLCGSWGEVKVQSAKPTIRFIEDKKL